MMAATVVTTAIAGSTPTVVIANPANPAHLSLPIGNIFYIYISLVRLEFIPYSHSFCAKYLYFLKMLIVFLQNFL